MSEIFKKYKYHFMIATLALFILFFCLPFTTRLNVKENGFYYEKEEVALYILTYDELPPNFIIKSQATTIYASYYDAIDDGFNIGGDIFSYEGNITSLTTNSSLFECDIYLDRDYLISVSNRGTDRLVFTSDGSEVFYTHDHYLSFDRITIMEIQSVSIIWSVVLFLYSAGILMIYMLAYKNKWITKSEIKLARTKIIIFLRGFFELLYALVKVALNLFKKKDTK